MNSLQTWLEENDPELLELARKVMAERPGWDLMDATDSVDSETYHHWCEVVND